MGIFDVFKRKKEDKKELALLYNYIDYSKEPSSKEMTLEIGSFFGSRYFQELHRYVVENQNDYNDVLKTLAESLTEMDLLKACASSHFYGAMIENIGVCGIEKNLIDLFEKVVNLNCEFINNHIEDVDNADWDMLYDKFPEEVKAYKGAELLTLAVMAVITREPQARYYLRSKNLYNKIEFLARYIKPMVYVTIVHNACDDLKVLVLSPETKKGFWVKAFDISTCYHLISLLEAEIYQKGWNDDYGMTGYEFDNEIYDVITGAVYPKKLYSMESHAAYHTYFEVKDEKERGSKSALSNTIYGEMPPEYIPQYKGYPIIIMDKDSMKGRKCWDSNSAWKCHDALNPHIEILGELSAAETEEWLQSLLSDEIKSNSNEENNDIQAIKILNSMVAKSVAEGDTLLIPDINLQIKANVLKLKDNVAYVKFYLNHPSFIESLDEFTSGIGGSSQEALINAVTSFNIAALSGIEKALRDDGGEDFECQFNNKLNKFKVYESKKAILGEKEEYKEVDYWHFIKEEIRKRLGNKPIYWVKVYLSKTESSSECECRINGLVSIEISDRLEEIVQEWNIKQAIYSEKQYFVLVQDKSTYVPYKFTKSQIVEYTEKAIELYKDCDTDEKYDELDQNVFDMCRDNSLTCELTRFIPEMLCEMVFTEAKYPEYQIIDRNGEMITLYKDAMMNYNWIAETLYNKLNTGGFSEEQLKSIVGVSATAKAISAALKKESSIENLKSSIVFCFNDDYVIY